MNIRLSPRLYVDSALVANTVAPITPEQTHYLQHVMRLKTGDTVRLFNERDGEWRASIHAISKRAMEIILHQQIRAPQPEPDLWLCCAPIKKNHFTFMLEKATELGVTAIHPLLTARTQVRDVNVERSRAIAIEAAEQSERLSIPAIHPPVSLRQMIATWPHDRTMIVCAELGDAAPIHAALTARITPTAKVAIVTGPEGGFAAEELAMLREVPSSVFVRLGPRILRADTAAIAALSVWQAVCGDWTSAPTSDTRI